MASMFTRKIQKYKNEDKARVIIKASFVLLVETGKKNHSYA